MDLIIKLADDIIMRGKSLYAIIEAQRKGEEVTLAHRDQTLAGALKIMSRNNPNDPLIKPEEMKEYRGYIWKILRIYMERDVG